MGSFWWTITQEFMTVIPEFIQTVSYPRAHPVGQLPKSQLPMNLYSYPRAHNSGQLHEAHTGGQLPKNTSL